MTLDLNQIYNLAGKSVIVTGAAQGMGAAIARQFAAMGARMTLADVRMEQVQALAQETGGQAVAADMGSEADVVALIATARAKFGGIDILVNNAGIQDRRMIEDTELAFGDRRHAINLRGVMVAIREVGAVMRADGTRGAIVNIASNSAFHPMAPSLMAYAAAKAGVINFTKTAALELALHGIRVNALAPDITLTEGMAAVAPPGAEARFGLTVPMGRAGHVDEMAGAAVFLAGDLSSYVTGQTIHVDGGTHASSGWTHHPETGAYILGSA